MSEPARPFKEIFAELQAAHRASMVRGAPVKAISAWSVLIDKYASDLFTELQLLQNGLEMSAKILLEKEAELGRDAVKRAELEAKIENIELREANAHKTLARVVHERDEQIKQLARELAEEKLRSTEREKLYKEALTNAQLINSDLAKTAAGRFPGLIKRGSLLEGTEALSNGNGYHPPLIGPAIMREIDKLKLSLPKS